MNKKYFSKTLAYPWSEAAMDSLLNDGYLVLNCTEAYCLLVKIVSDRKDEADGEALQEAE